MFVCFLFVVRGGRSKAKHLCGSIVLLLVPISLVLFWFCFILSLNKYLFHTLCNFSQPVISLGGELLVCLDAMWTKETGMHHGCVCWDVREQRPARLRLHPDTAEFPPLTLTNVRNTFTQRPWGTIRSLAPCQPYWETPPPLEHHVHLNMVFIQHISRWDYTALSSSNTSRLELSDWSLPSSLVLTH